MEIVNKAIAKASDMANEAAWNAQQRIKINTEEKRLIDLRTRAVEKRAEIGDEMYKLWQAHKLPPSQLDNLFYELQDIIDAIGSSAENLDTIKAQTYDSATSAQIQTASSYAAAVPQLPVSPLGPAIGPGQAPPALSAGPQQQVIDVTPSVPLTSCPSCHSMVRADRNFCGRCGQRLPGQGS
jgi:hypothetical protein